MKKYSKQLHTGLRLAELTTANRKPCFITNRKSNAMKVNIFLFIAIIVCCFEISAQSTNVNLIDMNNAELLDELDRILTDKESFENKKKAKLEHLKNELESATDNEQRYWTARNIYNEYKTYDSDSALYYVDLSLNFAKIANRQKWIDEMNICRSYIYAATGLLEEAQKSINEINTELLDRNLFLQYNEQQLFLYTHRDQYLGLNTMESPYTAESMRLLENLIQDLPLTDSQYCWFKGWYSLSDVQKSKEAIKEVLPIIKESKFETVDDAKNSWILSRLYEKTGDNENKLKFLILSAIADVRTHNKEIASLEEVANIMYHQHNLKRANEYINYCLNCANEYKSRVRVGRLADLQHKITAAYQQETDEQSKDLHVYFIALISIVILLLLTLVFTFFQNRKLRLNKATLNEVNSQLSQQVEEQNKLQMQLEEANGKLSQQVNEQQKLQNQLKEANEKLSQQVIEQKSLQEQLRDANDQLIEANAKLKDMYSNAKQGTVELSETNYVKERYIADIFAICSNYINKLDDFRRNIHAMLMAHRYVDLKELTKNPELSYAEVKELYQIFDRIFLGIYPDFVRDFNTLLRPEEQIILKKGEQLNTELRIYALVRLGLNDSTKIAQFLHCSVRTVYNTRQRIRNKAIIPKEEFAKTVKSLGKIAY